MKIHRNPKFELVWFSGCSGMAALSFQTRRFIKLKLNKIANFIIHVLIEVPGVTHVTHP